MSDIKFVAKRNGKWSARLIEKQVVDLLHSQELFDGTSWLDQEWNECFTVPVAPSIGYGMVIVDFDDRWIGAMQRYTSASEVYVLAHEVDGLKDRWEAGRIEDPALQFNTFDDFKAHLKHKEMAPNFSYHTIPLSPPNGWNTVDFHRSLEGDESAAALFNSLVNAGYHFTDDDIEGWRDFLDDEEEGVDMDQAWHALNSYLENKELSASTMPINSMRTGVRF